MTSLFEEHDPRQDSFWWWMWRVGLKRFIALKPILAAHLAVGALMARFVPGKLSEFAGSAFVPVAGILVGLTFAWSGNAASLLQSEEIQRTGAQDGGDRYRIYVFTYQAALLVVLILSVLWCLIAAKVFEQFSVASMYGPRMLGRVIVFSFSSLTFRECWQACVGVQQMLLMQMRQRQTAAQLRAIIAAHKEIQAPESPDPVPVPERHAKH